MGGGGGWMSRVFIYYATLRNIKISIRAEHN